MYLKKLTVNNFRAFEHFEWEIEAGHEAGWHVLLGPNGCGKSSVLKAIALAMAGDKQFYALRIPVDYFVRIGSEAANIDLNLNWKVYWDKWAEKGKMYGADRDLPVSMTLTSGGVVSSSGAVMDRTIWSDKPGWFSAAFGPMRRFSGGNQENLRVFKGFPRLARHLSIFGEDVALTESLEWLKELHHLGLEAEKNVTNPLDVGFKTPLLERITHFINQEGFLPHGTRFESVSAASVNFSDGNGVSIPVLELSDGFRAVLSLTFELIRLMTDCYGESDIFSIDDDVIIAPGIVLIDEIDAHLHPEWQRTIGPWLTKLFPNIQFIVTTHSPYICQNAVRGSIWHLPAPGTDQSPKRITGEQLNKVLYGDVLHILNSEAFGGMPGRSEAASAQLDRLAALNRLESIGTIDQAQALERTSLSEKLSSVLPHEI